MGSKPYTATVKAVLEREVVVWVDEDHPDPEKEVEEEAKAIFIGEFISASTLEGVVGKEEVVSVTRIGKGNRIKPDRFRRAKK